MQPLRFVLQKAKNYRRLLLAGLGGMLGLVSLELLVPLIVRGLVAAVRTGAQSSESLALVGKLALALLAIYLLRMVFQFIQSYMNHKAGEGGRADFKNSAAKFFYACFFY
jgi:ABC-type multidrug transport system fused ATPase/permease subunit